MEEDMTLLNINLVEPARRHKCEECGKIFECHICDIRWTHPIHTGSCSVSFLCSPCAIKLNMLYALTVSSRNNRHIGRIYDYLSGKIDTIISTRWKEDSIRWAKTKEELEELKLKQS
jgi:hypothetical protein